MDTSLTNISFEPKSIIGVDGGNVYHVFKANSYRYNIGEIYFSSIEKGFIKGWKMQTMMNSKFCVPHGNVQFIFVSKDFKHTKTFCIGEDNYGLLSVPKNIWYCFKGISNTKSLILNLADREHNNNYIKKINLAEFPLKLKI